MNDKSKLKLHPHRLEKTDKESRRFNDLFEDSNETISSSNTGEKKGPYGPNTLEALFVLDDKNLGNHKKPSNKKSKDSKHFDDYQIYNFLEREYQRLKQIDIFFSRKLELLSHHPQGKKLLVKQTDKCTRLKQELISLLVNSDSPLNKHLETLWDESI